MKWEMRVLSLVAGLMVAAYAFLFWELSRVGFEGLARAIAAGRW